MKITRRFYLRQKLFIIVPLLLVLLGSLGAYGYYRWTHQKTSTKGSNKTSQVNYNPPTEGQKEAGQNTKNSTVNNTSGKPAAPGTDTAQPPTNSGTINVTITAANQNGGTLSIRSLIEAVTSSGSCTLTLTKGSTVVTKTSDIQPLANSSTCKGFDIPTSELSTGQWHIQLNVAVDNKTGLASKDITIQ